MSAKTKARKANGVQQLREFVLERRHRLRLRQQDLADRTGLSLPWVASFETGRLGGPPRKDTLIKLSQGLSLPNETPGGLFHYLELILLGSIGAEIVSKTAKGEMSLEEAVEHIQRKAQALDELVEVMSDHAAVFSQVLHSREFKSQRLEQALSIIKIDLSPQDFAVASMLLHRLYDQLPVPLQPPPTAAPRRRRASSSKKGD